MKGCNFFKFFAVLMVLFFSVTYLYSQEEVMQKDEFVPEALSSDFKNQLDGQLSLLKDALNQEVDRLLENFVQKVNQKEEQERLNSTKIFDELQSFIDLKSNISIDLETNINGTINSLNNFIELISSIKSKVENCKSNQAVIYNNIVSVIQGISELKSKIDASYVDLDKITELLIEKYNLLSAEFNKSNFTKNDLVVINNLFENVNNSLNSVEESFESIAEGTNALIAKLSEESDFDTTDIVNNFETIENYILEIRQSCNGLKENIAKIKTDEEINVKPLDYIKSLQSGLKSLNDLNRNRSDFFAMFY